MIRVFEPKIYYKDKLAVWSAVSKKNISGSSIEISKFEKSLAQYFNREYAVAVSNGSVALDIAFQNLDLKEDDEVILPAFTIISCLAAVIRSGAKPIFCDVESDSWNMSIDNIKKVYSPKTKAILMVHTYGLTADVDNILKFCEENNVILIEDSSEAHGQEFEGMKCGTFGLMSTLSFYANKHITSGEGGAVLTNDKEVYQNIIQMKNLDFNNNQRFQHENFYWNYRLGSLQAALGRSSINSIEKTIYTKIKKAKVYDELLSDYSDLIEIPLRQKDNVRNHYWVYGILLKEGISRDGLIDYLYKKNIETRPFFWPLNKQEAYQKVFNEVHECPNSERLGRQGLYIPIGGHVTINQQKQIIKEIIDGIGFLTTA